MEQDYYTALSITTIAAIGWTSRGECHHGAGGGAGGPNALLACLQYPCPDDYFKWDWSAGPSGMRNFIPIRYFCKIPVYRYFSVRY